MGNKLRMRVEAKCRHSTFTIFPITQIDYGQKYNGDMMSGGKWFGDLLAEHIRRNGEDSPIKQGENPPKKSSLPSLDQF
jgi:hypothetical protein